MKHIFFILIILYFSVSHVSAEELTLKQCIELALEHNQGLKTYETDLSASRENIHISRTGFLPALKLRGSYTLLDKSDRIIMESSSFATGIPPQDVELSAENRTMYTLGLHVEQPIFTGGQLSHTFLKTKVLNKEAGYVFERQKRLLVFEVKSAYYQALKEKLYKEALKKVIEAKKERLRVLHEQYTEGYVQKQDILLAETDLSASELELFKTKNHIEYSHNKLKNLMYYQNEGEIVLKSEPLKGILNVTLLEIKETAMKNRDDLKISLTRIEAAKEDIMISRSDFYPKAFLNAGYIVQKETNIDRPELWMLMVHINWPIFEWGKTKSEVKRAEALLQRQKFSYEELTQSIRLEAEKVWRLVKDKEKEVEFKEKRLKTTEYRFTKMIERYAEGVVKLADLLEMEAELLKSYNEYIAEINDFHISLAQLELIVSSIKDIWLSREDIYMPDFKSFSENIKKLISKKKEKTTYNESMRIMTEVKNTHDDTIRVKIGTFTLKQNAENLRDNLSKRMYDNRVLLQQDGKFYKVWITGFKDKKEAEMVVKELGIKEYSFSDGKK